MLSGLDPLIGKIWDAEVDLIQDIKLILRRRGRVSSKDLRICLDIIDQLRQVLIEGRRERAWLPNYFHKFGYHSAIGVICKKTNVPIGTASQYPKLGLICTTGGYVYMKPH